LPGCCCFPGLSGDDSRIWIEKHRNLTHIANSSITCLDRLKTSFQQMLPVIAYNQLCMIVDSEVCAAEMRKRWHQAPLRFLALVMGPVLGPAAAGRSTAAASAGTVAIASRPAASWLGWAASKASGASAAFLLPAVGLKRRSWQKKNRCEEQLVIRLYVMPPFIPSQGM